MTQIYDRSDRPLKQHDHHPKNDAQLIYQRTTKIKNSNTHLGIMIRWVHELDLGRVAG